MSIRAFDRAQDAYNLAKKNPVQQKVIVFIIPSKLKEGVVKTEVRFPYIGEVIDVYATCGTMGLSPTEIHLEKCPQVDYDTTPNWVNILDSGIIIDSNEKSTNTASVPVSIGIGLVEQHDHFRVNVITVGEGVEDVTVEVVVKI